MYFKLKKYHNWWYKNRDFNQNGIAEYGATKHPLHNDIEGNILFEVSSDDKTLVKNCTFD
jgi:putative isomerase